MKRLFGFVTSILLVTTFVISVQAQRGSVFTGTAVIYGSGASTRTISRSFTLSITGRTSDADAASYLRTLQDGGQDALMRQIGSKELGRFALSGSVGQPVNAVLVERDGDETVIRAVFRRWIGFGELRRGLRSVDYPFGYVEIRIDRNGRGDGQIIPAAKVRFRGGNTIEVEDFGTFPGRLMGVRMRGTQLP
jgi:hypothetical protein